MQSWWIAVVAPVLAGVGYLCRRLIKGRRKSQRLQHRLQALTLLQAMRLRLRSFDTPEPYTAICGGPQEVALAKRASVRLLELLNSNPFTVETFGLDATRRRTLATIRIDGHDVGDILIEERLARKWPDGEEWWCG